MKHADILVTDVFSAQINRMPDGTLTPETTLAYFLQTPQEIIDGIPTISLYLKMATMADLDKLNNEYTFIRYSTDSIYPILQKTNKE